VASVKSAAAVVWTLLLACASSGKIGSHESLELRGVHLWGSCESVVAFETPLAVFHRDEVVDGVRSLGFIDRASHAVIAYCQHGRVCSHSITEFFDSSQRASDRCAELRELLLASLGDPTSDFQTTTAPPESETSYMWDKGLFNILLWQSDRSSVSLSCPLDPDGEGRWTVNVDRGSSPSLRTSPGPPGVIVVEPERGCDPPVY